MTTKDDMKAFESFIQAHDVINVIRIYRGSFAEVMEQMTGVGTEYWVRTSDNIVHKFINGNLMGELPRGNQEVTVVPQEAA